MKQLESSWNEEEEEVKEKEEENGEEEEEEVKEEEEEEEEKEEDDVAVVVVDDDDDEAERRRNEEEPLSNNSAIAVSIENLRNDLESLIEFRHGLLDTLLDMELLVVQEIEAIQSRQEPNEQISLLLDYVVGMPQYQQEQFLVALENTRQSHVAAYIRANGCWPSADSHSGAISLLSLDELWLDPI